MITAVIGTALSIVNSLDLAIVVRATIVLAVGLTALVFARRARASVRHLMMAATLGTVLVLPLVMSTVPPLTVPVSVPGGEMFARPVPNPVADAVVAASSVGLKDDANHASLSLPSFATLLRSIWAVGTALLLLGLAIDLRRLRSLRRAGLPWLEKKDLVRSLAIARGVRTPVDVLLHEGIHAPLTCGLRNPAILLPIDANDWSAADLRRALVHELEHLRRGDWATQLVGRVVCACYWFHPLIWMAWQRLHLEAERACDDAVLECTESTQYAEQLVSLARRMSTARTLPSLAMANRSDLSARVVALLDGTQSRGRVGSAAAAGVVSVAGLVAVLVACLRASTAQAAAPVATRTAPPGKVVVREMNQRSLPVRENVRRTVSRLNARVRISQNPSRPQLEPTTASPHFDSRWLSILRANGVSDDFVRGLTDAGYTNLTPDDVLNLFHRGITPDFIASLRRVGLTHLTIGELLAAQDHGLTESFIHDFRDLGYTELGLGDFLALRSLGVTADFARRQAETNGPVSINELIARRIRGDR